MSERKHTKGPWLVEPSFRERKLHIILPKLQINCPGSGGSESYTQIIATTDGGGTEEWEANANLMAAAPDLLEAVEVILDAANDRLADGLGHELPPIVRYKLERAVAKAKGEV